MYGLVLQAEGSASAKAPAGRGQGASPAFLEGWRKSARDLGLEGTLQMLGTS